jgi:hypothetical protein
MGLEQLGDRLIRFAGGQSGVWRVLAIRPVLGDTLPEAERVAVCRGDEPSPLKSQWTLSGVISNVRYVERPEQQELTLKEAPLGRSEATLAALIPVRKTAAWWNLTQEERRSISTFVWHEIETRAGGFTENCSQFVGKKKSRDGTSMARNALRYKTTFHVHSQGKSSTRMRCVSFEFDAGRQGLQFAWSLGDPSCDKFSKTNRIPRRQTIPNPPESKQWKHAY